jgi:hypothetical protein
MESLFTSIGLIIIVISGVVGFSIGRDYSKFEQVALKHCLTKINSTCESASCESEEDNKYKCQVIYSSMINDNIVRNSLNITCNDKTCE